jgi:hypothetical protein
MAELKLTHVDKYLDDHLIEVVKDMKNSLSGMSIADNLEIIDGSDGLSSISMPHYGIYIDKGRKAGKMPYSGDLKEWAASKNIDESALYPIARSIGKNGIKARPFIDKALDIDELVDEVSEGFKLDIIDTID